MKQSIWRELILSLWDIWERLFGLIFHIRQVEPGNLFRINVRQYRGPAVELRDGTVITPGERVGELHLANKELIKIQTNCSNHIKATMCVKREMKQSLAQLARLVMQKKVEDVKAFYGITIFHQGARLLGFEVRELQPGFWRFCYWVGQMLLLALYHPTGLKRLKLGHHTLTPKVVWLSRAILLRDFSPAGNS